MQEPANPETAIYKSAICEEVEDLYTPNGRRAIAVAAGAYLRQLRLTPVELLHVPRQQLAYNDAGTTLTQAVQKASIAQVRGTTIAVSQRVRTLFSLTEAIRTRTRERHEQDKPAPVTRETLTDLLGHVSGERLVDRSFRIFSGLALAIDGLTSWAEKIDVLFDLGADLAGMDTYAYFDAIISELLRAPEGFTEVLGDFDPPGEKITALLALYRGTAGVEQAPPTPARARTLYQLAAIDPMPETRQTLLDHALHTLRADGRLTRATVDGELDFLLELAETLRPDGELLGGPATEAAIERRELQLISDQTIDMLMANTPAHGAKLLRAFELHERVVGERTRRYLEDYVASLMREEQVGQRIAETSGDLVDHVATLGQLNRAALRSTMAARTADRFASQFEKLQALLVEQTKFFDTLAQREGSVSGTAMALLDLLAARGFARGPMTQAARRYAHALMKQPSFMTSYLEQVPDGAARRRKLKDLEQRIVASGLD